MESRARVGWTSANAWAEDSKRRNPLEDHLTQNRPKRKTCQKSFVISVHFPTKKHFFYFRAFPFIKSSWAQRSQKQRNNIYIFLSEDFIWICFDKGWVSFSFWIQPGDEEELARLETCERRRASRQFEHSTSNRHTFPAFDKEMSMQHWQCSY